ncbi:uncharacterized protein LOC110008176 [Amborella trichopoda]|uniref:uncharacterized protein LOC110008176 n=1 Tax=Amborella trichopoda TaxID=13333 RepID=UPI0009C198E6|nr:uncharacterized protein LOC110008176 [Amborella trichopoda]|eukprot:XP_020529645.1 uncharacterized protein LOC110008176 [Amborella trichopoda]
MGSEPHSASPARPHRGKKPTEVAPEPMAEEIPEQGSKKKRLRKKKVVEVSEAIVITAPKVPEKSIRKNTMSSPIIRPMAPVTSSEGVTLPPRPEKRVNMGATSSPIHILEATTPIPKIVSTVVKTQPSISGQTSFKLSRQVESAPPLIVEKEAPLAERPVKPVIEQTLDLSPLSQGDLLCTITEEGDILEAEPEVMDEAPVVTTSEVSAPVISEAKPQTFAPSNATLELVLVLSSKAPISTISYVETKPAHVVEAVPKPCVSSNDLSALAPQEPVVLAEPPPLVTASYLLAPMSSTTADVKASTSASFL